MEPIPIRIEGDATTRKRNDRRLRIQVSVCWDWTWLVRKVRVAVHQAIPHQSIKELAGDLLLWALLATINDLPVTISKLPPPQVDLAKEVRTSDHRTIRLTVPEKHYRRLQPSVVASQASPQVRGHWRKDWRHPDSWIVAMETTIVVIETSGTTLECKTCGQRKTWITEHQRGAVSWVCHSPL
jgi:hypothetical protein